MKYIALIRQPSESMSHRHSVLPTLKADVNPQVILCERNKF